MAHDLIPPPSPAGRPEPDASGRHEPPPPLLPDPAVEERTGGGLWSGDEPPAAIAAGRVPAEPTAPAAPLESLPPSPYRRRFGFVMGALVAVGVAALALTGLVLAGAGSDDGPTGWSEWRPQAEDSVGAAREIANHVAPQYRLSSGGQIVLVQAGPLEIADLPLSVAMRSAAQDGDIDFVEGNGVMYTLNGLGPRGSIKDGRPSAERLLLLRREALELALYTFRYAKDVDLVVALLPPAPPKADEPPASSQATSALFFRPGDLERQLEAPLRTTIPLRTPRPEAIPGAEGQRIDQLTERNFFLASFQQAQDARAFLVLDRPVKLP